jgi:hypothetical protein
LKERAIARELFRRDRGQTFALRIATNRHSVFQPLG